MIVFLFRVPKFPIICNIDGYLVSAKDKKTFQARMAKTRLRHGASYYAVDSTGENWRIDATNRFISPTMSRKASKKKIIESYNASQNCETNDIQYLGRSLSSKRFERIFSEIIELVEKSQSREQHQRFCKYQ